MIKKSVIFCFLVLVGWTLFLAVNPTISNSQHQWQSNTITAEKFLYDTDSVQNIIVGTSLAHRIHTDSLPNFYNLALGGQSLFDGLHLIRQKKTLPKRIFIETNFITTPATPGFQEKFNTPAVNWAKENIAPLRSDKQPLAYLGNQEIIPLAQKVRGFLQRVEGKIKFEINKRSEKGLAQPQQNLKKEDIFNNMLAIEKDNFSEEIDPKLLRNQFEQLKEQLQYLQQQGVQIIFFEMPINMELRQANLPKTNRETLKNQFPPNEYTYIPVPENSADYKTTDGLHLDAGSASRYTQYLNQYITHDL